MSPDGVWCAYTTGTRLKLQRVVGGAVRDLGPGVNNVSHISWLPDSRRLAAREVPPDRGTARWFLYNIESGELRPLWEQPRLEGTIEAGIDGAGPAVIADGELIQLAWSPDGGTFAGVAPGQAGTMVWTFDADGGSARNRLSEKRLTFPEWRPDSSGFDCLSRSGDVQFIDRGCSGGAHSADAPEAYGPIAFSTDGRSLYYGSPNGKWIVFHTHADGSDDVWLQPADGSSPPRQLSFDGYETGWPRWSPDGRWIVYPSMVPAGAGWGGVLFVVGVDQESGQVTGRPKQLDLGPYEGEPFQAEWAPDSARLVFEGYDGGVEQGIYVVSREGGTPERVHAFESDQIFSGMSVSPDFRWAAYIAPTPDGYFQVFRASMSGGLAEQLTFDPSDKIECALPTGDFSQKFSTELSA